MSVREAAADQGPAELFDLALLLLRTLGVPPGNRNRLLLGTTGCRADQSRAGLARREDEDQRKPGSART